MKLALLMGNRFSAWHLQGFRRLRGNPAITGFRAESQIQDHFRQRDDGSLQFAFEPIYFDTQVGNPFARMAHVIGERYFDREPRIVPFRERLKGFDIVQSWELFTDWTEEALIARERYGVPLSVMVWDNIPFNMERNPERRARKQRVAAKADRFLVYTERSRRTLDIEGVPAERITRINPGIDTDVFRPGPPRRRELGLREDDFVILFVGWMLPRKGIDFLLLAMRELVHDPAIKGRAVRLAIVGAGAGRERVEGLVERLGLRDRCTFLGALTYDRMPEVYRSADLFVLPSVAAAEWQEQFGMSLIEAMACGVPSVASMSGAIPEITGEPDAQDAGAKLCQPNDFVSLYEVIKRLIEDGAERKHLSTVGRARATRLFSLEQHVQALSDVYEALAGSRS